MTDSPGTDEEGKRLSKRTKVIIVVVIVAMVSAIGTFEAHTVALNSSLSPNNLILSSSELSTIMPKSNDWNVPYLPSGNNVASADYTNSSPLPAFGGNVTTPNVVIVIVQNSSNKSALSGYYLLKSHLQEVISSGISVGRLSNITVANYSGEYFGFYNTSKSIGAIVTAIYNYIVLVIVYNFDPTDLIHLFTQQTNKLSSTVEFDQTHFIF